MIVAMINKNTGNIEYTFTSKSVKYTIGYSEEKYKAFKLDPAKHKQAYYYDSNTDSVKYDDSYIPPTADPSIAIEQIIKNAMIFGNDIIVKFATENVLMGITQLGKTKEVSDYLADLTRYAQTGSLYEVVNEIDRLIAAGLPLDLEPFITEQRLLDFRQNIMDYLA